MTESQVAPKPDSSGALSRSVWFDLPAVNLADAMSFYQGLLDWTYQRMEDSPLADYVMIEVGGKLIGGIRKVTSSPRRTDTATPLIYFTVKELASKMARAKELGAELVGETVSLGHDRGVYGWIRDREGNLIGLWAPQ